MNAATASALIPRMQGQRILLKKGFNTADIVKEVLDNYRDNRQQLAAFAQSIKGSNDYESCSNIWTFIKTNIRYQVDPGNYQLPRTPARLWADKVGDCKSFSIFAASALYCLGIPGCIRFVSYSNQPVPTHVYVVAYPNGREIKIDAVIEAFDKEKPYTYKIDYDMNELYRLAGTGEIGKSFRTNPKVKPAAKPLQVVDNYRPNQPKYSPRPGEFELPLMADGTTTDELIEAAILKQRLEIERSMLNRVAGIGSTVDAYSEQVINDLDARIKAAVNGVDVNISGGFFKKIFKGVKKVVLAPVKLAQKIVMAPFALVLNKKLPAAAMAYIYIFLPEKVCSKLPPVICEKRNRQLKQMRKIVNIVGMKESHFRGLITNGIMKQTGKTPLAFLSEKFKIAITGIGVFTPSAKLLNSAAAAANRKNVIDKTSGALLNSGNIWAMAGGAVLKLIQAIVSIFKKKDKDLPETKQDVNAMLPADTDFQNVDQQAAEVLYKEAANEPSKLQQVLETAGTVATAVKEVAQTFNTANNNLDSVPQQNDNGTGSNYSNTSTANQYDADTTNTGENSVIVTADKKESNNVLLLGGLGLAAIALFAATSRKR